jgi:hypothetical protein
MVSKTLSMIKPSFKNILIYIYIKYFLFYVFMMFKNHDFTLIDIGELKSVADWEYYLWIFLSLPSLSAALFSAPNYYSLKVRRPWILFLLVGATFVIEYFVYTYVASPSDFMNGIYLEILGTLLFLLFFYRVVPRNFDRQLK